MKTPVVMFAYNRADLLRETLENLSRCHEIDGRDVFIFVDGPKDVPGAKDRQDGVVEVINDFQRDRLPALKATVRPENVGCGKNIQGGISEVLASHPARRVIVVEDDILVSRTFLKFMDEALEYYEDERRVFSINGHFTPLMYVPHGFAYDIFFSPRNGSWGWATWADRWQKVDFSLSDWPQFKAESDNLAILRAAGNDLEGMIERQFCGEMHTWDVQVSYHMVKNRLFSVNPVFSLTKNVGFGCGTHTLVGDPLFAKQSYYNHSPRLRPFALDPEMLAQMPRAEMDPGIWWRRKLLRLKRRLCSTWFWPDNRYPKEVE